MKAVRIENGNPVLVDIDAPGLDGDDVRVKVAAVGICGSDLHLIDAGFAEGRVLGHEIAGYLDDGTAVAIEPFRTCGTCVSCVDGDRHRCAEGTDIIGIMSDGGMAEYLAVPPAALVMLPTGLDVRHASFVENMAVALHAVNRARLEPGDRIGVVGAGPIGLAVATVLGPTDFVVDVGARHDHQRAAVEPTGASVELTDGYDVVIDAVGTTQSIDEAVRRCRHGGRISVVGSFWDPIELGMPILLKEVELIPAMMYGASATGREIDEAAALLAKQPAIGEAFITHRFPLDGAPEAFAAARDRSAGAIKVIFEP